MTRPLDLPISTLRAIRTLTRNPCPKCGQDISQGHIGRQFNISVANVSRIKHGHYDDIIDGHRAPHAKRTSAVG